MSNRNEILNKAIDIINQRRNRAKAINDMHFEEVNEKIPEISEINSQLVRTGIEILNVVRSGENVHEKIEKLKSRNLQAQQMIRSLLHKYGYPEDYLHIRYTCEECSDTGFSGNKQCSCLRKLVMQLSSEKMNAGSQVRLCRFDTFRIDYYYGNTTEETAEYRDVMRHIFDYCQKYAAGFTTNSNNILMFGKTGLGKTHLSLAIAREVMMKGYNVLYDSSLNYLRKVEREHFGRDTGSVDTLEMLLSAELLIMDDLGSEYDTSFYSSTMYNIINTRMSCGLPTIINTNLDHEKLNTKYDDRIVSRLFAEYKPLQFVGRDIRVIKRKNGEQLENI